MHSVLYIILPNIHQRKSTTNLKSTCNSCIPQTCPEHHTWTHSSSKSQLQWKHACPTVQRPGQVRHQTHCPYLQPTWISPVHRKAGVWGWWRLSWWCQSVWEARHSIDEALFLQDVLSVVHFTLRQVALGDVDQVICSKGCQSEIPERHETIRVSAQINNYIKISVSNSSTTLASPRLNTSWNNWKHY